METTTVPDYPRGLTFEQVWASIKATEQLLKTNAEKADKQWEQSRKEYEERQKEYDKRQKEEAAERQKEHEKRQKEAAERQKESDKRQKEYEERQKEADERRKAADERQKAADERQKKIDRQIEKLEQQMGGLHNSFGDLAEHLVAPGIVERFNDLGYHFTGVSPGGTRFYGKDRKIKIEIDLLLENGDYIMAVEVKSKPKEKHVEHQLKCLEILRELKNDTKDLRKIRGAIAGAIFDVGVKNAALEAGLYVLEQSGDTMKMEIPEDFVPREW